MIANLDQLFQRITGYALPETQPSTLPPVFTDEMGDLDTTQAPENFAEVAADVGEFASGAVDAIAGMFESPSIRDLIELCEFFQPKTVNVGNIHFDRSASQVARQRFQADVAQARQLFGKVGLGNIVEGRIYLADMTEIISGKILAGQYWANDDTTMVSLTHGLTEGRYTMCLVHELAHRFHHLNNNKKAPNSKATLDRHLKAFFDWAEDNPEVFPTRYAKQDHMEFFAETVTAFLMGKNLDPRVKEWIEATLRAFR